MKQLLFFLILAIFLVSCRQEQQRAFVIGRVVVSSSPEDEKIISPIDSFSGPSLFGAGMLAGVSDSLVIIGVKPQSGSLFCFRALNVWKQDYVDFLNRGRGPGEVLSAGSAGFRREGDKMLFDVNAVNDHLLLTLDLDATCNEGKAVINNMVELLDGPISPYSFCLGQDIVSVVLFDEDYYSVKRFSAVGHEMHRVSQIFGNEPYLAEYYVAFGIGPSIKPDRTKLVMPMIYFDEIGIYDLEGEDHLSVSSSRRTGSKSKIEQMMAGGDEPTQVYYRDCSVTDDAIYALYCNCDSKEMETSLPAVQVFSWEGRLKAIYHLNEPLYSISVSEDGRTLYGLTEEEVLYRYDLSQ